MAGGRASMLTIPSRSCTRLVAGKRNTSRFRHPLLLLLLIMLLLLLLLVLLPGIRHSCCCCRSSHRCITRPDMAQPQACMHPALPPPPTHVTTPDVP